MHFVINRRMLVYKFFYLFSLAAMSIIPFLSLHFKQVGMSPFRIGILSSARPIFLALSAPVIGYLTDKYQAPKVTVFVCGCFWIGSTFTMGFATIPFVEENECETIQKDLYQRKINCELKAVSSFKLRSLSDTYPNHHENISAEYLFRKARQNFSEHNLTPNNVLTSCDSLDTTLEADRSWMYTSESLQKIFYILLLCNCLFDMSFNPLHSIADAESVNTLQDMDIDIADYGKQRAFGSCGWALGPLIFGPWIMYTRASASKCGVELIKADYKPMFIVFQVMAVGTMLTTLGFSFKYKQESHGSYTLDRNVIKQLCKLPNLAILFVVFFIGVCNGTLHGYLFWYLDTIGGDELIMGMASAVHGVSGFILGLSTGAAIRQFGHFPLITVGIFTYLVRFIYYAYVKQPWWILGSEIFHSLTFLLTWNTSISYLSQIVPEDYRTSLASLLNSLYHGFGNAFGYVISGYLVQRFGSVNTFQIFAVLNAVVAAIIIPIFLVNSGATKDSNPDKERSIILWPDDSSKHIKCTMVQQQVHNDENVEKTSRNGFSP
ncbi:major facilitator superfamily domain-containing protein 6-A-like [Amphiura filiformis]|uniref:major facilitator superfamily domain-containing protein 6-A-like n=1 Tax=Amphiura filiformis TaxID=82378 RepID=UPI003B21A7F7